MPKINPLITFGCILVLVGLAGPWFCFFTFYKNDYTYLRYEMSPFFLIIKKISIEGPIAEITVTNHYLFYGSDVFLIGICCISGSVLGIIGEIKSKWKIVFSGGALSILSILFFFLCLPGYISGLSLGWGMIVTALGSIFIVLSIGLKFFISKLKLSGLVIF